MALAVNVYGAKSTAKIKKVDPVVKKAHAKQAKQVAPSPVRVVVDAGHGGKDTGAIGPSGVYEKNIVLAISREVKHLLVGSGVEAVLTRDGDTFLPLEERSALANRVGAAAFVSIHANSAHNRDARGIETYYLAINDSRYVRRLTSVENAWREDQVTDFEVLLADLLTKASHSDSKNLAQNLQNKLVQGASQFGKPTRDLGVKGALFYVLLGARMPAALIETSFLSHPEEGKYLMRPAYQKSLAKAIADALVLQFGRSKKSLKIAKRG